MKEVCIIGYGRTPIGDLLGSLSKFTAVELATMCLKGLSERYKIDLAKVQELYLGNVLSAGLGQAPAKQVALGAGMSESVPCTQVNKGCASGMKAVMLAAQSIQLGINDLVVAGGAESMSNAPHYMSDLRGGNKYGNSSVKDALVIDGLKDPYNGDMMGECAEVCAEGHSVSREEQDAYSWTSYERARKAKDSKVFDNEIIPILYKDRKKNEVVIDSDEELANKRIVNQESFSKLRTIFKANGTVTPGNASKLNDGASMVILASRDKAESLGVPVLATIEGYADAAKEPVHFTTAPSLAIPKAIKNAKIDIKDVDLFEINEAFAVVALSNMKLLDIEHSQTNIYGGGVSIGHPLGSSGARIVCTLLNALTTEDKQLGVAGICNGGGGASALVIKR